jgi:hypothetical protein
MPKVYLILLYNLNLTREYFYNLSITSLKNIYPINPIPVIRDKINKITIKGFLNKFFLNISIINTKTAKIDNKPIIL